MEKLVISVSLIEGRDVWRLLEVLKYLFNWKLIRLGELHIASLIEAFTDLHEATGLSGV